MRAYLDDTELDRLSRQAAVIHARLRAHPGACGVCGGLRAPAESPCAARQHHQRLLDAAELLVDARLRHLRGLQPAR